MSLCFLICLSLLISEEDQLLCGCGPFDYILHVVSEFWISTSLIGLWIANSISILWFFPSTLIIPLEKNNFTQSEISIITFMVNVLGFLVKTKIFPFSWGFYNIVLYSSKSFIICFKIHLELICVWQKEEVKLCVIFTWISNRCSIMYWNDRPFPMALWATPVIYQPRVHVICLCVCF